MKDYIQFVTLLVNETAFDYYENRSSCIASSYCLSYVLNELGFKAYPIKVTAFIHPKSGGHGSCLGREIGDRLPPSTPGMWHGHLIVMVNDKWLSDPTLDQCCNEFMHPEPAVFDFGKPEHTSVDFADCEGWYRIDRRQTGFKHTRAARKWQWMPVARTVMEAIRKHQAFPPPNPQQVESM